MSELNLQRVKEKQHLIETYISSYREDKNNHFLFICLTGFPNFQNEYKNLNLPGETVVQTIAGLDMTANYS